MVPGRGHIQYDGRIGHSVSVGRCDQAYVVILVTYSKTEGTLVLGPRRTQCGFPGVLGEPADLNLVTTGASTITVTLPDAALATGDVNEPSNSMDRSSCSCFQ